MSDNDPIDTLRQLAQAQRETLASSTVPDEILAAMRADSAGSLRRRRRFGRWLAAIIGVGAIGGGTVAWAVLRHEQTTRPGTIGCYETASLDASVVVVSARAADPVDTCADAWRTQMPEWGEPPTLVGCVLPNGAAGVFPGDDLTCAALDLAVLDPGASKGDQQIADFQTAVTEELLTGGCLTPDVVEATVRSHLASSGLDGWTVTRMGTFGASNPCAVIEIQIEDKTVIVSAIPDIFASNQGG